MIIYVYIWTNSDGQCLDNPQIIRRYGITMTRFQNYITQFRKKTKSWFSICWIEKPSQVAKYYNTLFILPLVAGRKTITQPGYWAEFLPINPTTTRHQHVNVVSRVKLHQVSRLRFWLKLTGLSINLLKICMSIT